MTMKRKRRKKKKRKKKRKRKRKKKKRLTKMKKRQKRKTTTTLQPTTKPTKRKAKTKKAPKSQPMMRPTKTSVTATTMKAVPAAQEETMSLSTSTSLLPLMTQNQVCQLSVLLHREEHVRLHKDKTNRPSFEFIVVVCSRIID